MSAPFLAITSRTETAVEAEPARVIIEPTASPTMSAETVPETRLDSWKEIAAYLGRSERTVRRWEEKEGLPVHRLLHEKRGSVYAYKGELDAWWESKRQSIEATVPEPPQAIEAAPARRLSWRWIAAAAVVLTALTVGLANRGQFFG